VKPSKIEAHRVPINISSDTGAASKSVPLTVNHRDIPMVTFTLEPSGIPGLYGTTTGRVTSLSKASVTIEFSSPFRGYLHLHAVSEL